MHIVLGLLVAFLLVAIYARRTRSTRGCRWRADRTGDRDGRHFYRCMACGAETFVTGKGPPQFCGRTTQMR